MPNLIAVACPNCRTSQQVSPRDFGRALTCERCHRDFSPSPNDVLTDPPPGPKAEGPPASGKVSIECPGCHRPLNVRVEYLGKTLTCRFCESPFVAQAPTPIRSWPDTPAREDRPGDHAAEGPTAPAPPVALAPAETGPTEVEAAASPSDDRLGAIEARLDRLDRKAGEWEDSLSRLAGSVEQGRKASGTLAADVQAIRDGLGRLESEAESRWDTHREDSGSGLAAGLDEVREATRGELAQLRGELQALRDRADAEGGRREEDQSRFGDLEARLATLDDLARRDREWPGRLDEARAEFEAARRDQAGALDALRGETEAGLAELRREVGRLAELSAAPAPAEQAEWQARLDLVLVRLEADRAEMERAVAEHREEAEAGRRAIREELELIRDRPGTTPPADAEQAEWRGRLDQTIGRLEADRADLERSAAEHREEAEAGRRAIREELERLRDRQEPTPEAAERAEWQGRVDQTIGRLEAGRADLERTVAEHREEAKAGRRAIREELERLRHRETSFRDAATEQAEIKGRLDEALGEIQRLRLAYERQPDQRAEGEAAIRDLRSELERLRDQQAPLLRSALDQVESLRSELTALREDTARRVPPPAPAQEPPLPAPAQEPPIPAAPARPEKVGAVAAPAQEARHPLDFRALDLAVDQLDDSEQPTAGPRPDPGSPATARPDLGASRVEYEQLAAQFAAMMKTRPPREVIPVARRLIDYTQSRFGERSSEYALSLRNLAILLPSQGEFASALTLLLRALEICRETPGADHPSYGICLVDLAELQLLQGDRPQAKVLCEEALWIFRRTVGADHGLSARARNCLERVAAMEGADKGFGTISIMT